VRVSVCVCDRECGACVCVCEGQAVGEIGIAEIVRVFLIESVF